jgi:DNA-binding transcriptional LysR family regulator
MTLQQLRDFVAVVAHGGYRAAARALDVSQAGLTKSVSRLEKEHGVALIERAAGGIRLTSVGERFLRHAQAVVHEAGLAEEGLRAAAGHRAGHVSLGVSVEPALRLVPAVLADFRRAMPGVSLRVTQGVATALLAGVRENRLELAVTRLPPAFEAGDLAVQPLFESASVVVARAGHPLAGAAVTMEALSHAEWIVVGDPAQPAEDDPSMGELFDANGLPRPPVVAATDALFDALAVVASSDVLARLPAAAVDHPLIAGRLVALQLPVPASPRYAIAVVHKATRPLSAEARTLAAMLGSYARSRGAATGG